MHTARKFNPINTGSTPTNVFTIAGSEEKIVEEMFEIKSVYLARQIHAPEHPIPIIASLRLKVC